MIVVETLRWIASSCWLSTPLAVNDIVWLRCRSISWFQTPQDCEFTYLSVQILHLLGVEGPRTKEPARYIRYIYNRIILENATVRAAAVSSLARFGAAAEELRERITILLKRALFDNDDEVSRASVSCFHGRVRRRSGCCRQAGRQMCRASQGTDSTVCPCAFAGVQYHVNRPSQASSSHRLAAPHCPYRCATGRRCTWSSWAGWRAARRPSPRPGRCPAPTWRPR